MQQPKSRTMILNHTTRCRTPWVKCQPNFRLRCRLRSGSHSFVVLLFLRFSLAFRLNLDHLGFSCLQLPRTSWSISSRHGAAAKGGRRNPNNGLIDQCCRKISGYTWYVRSSSIRPIHRAALATSHYAMKTYGASQMVRCFSLDSMRYFVLRAQPAI